MEAFKLYRGLSDPLKFFCIVAFLFLSPLCAQSYYPDFDYFTDGERSEINSPRLIDSEYESDRLTYQFLSNWHLPWLAENNIFQYSAGSLGPTRFFTRGRFRFKKDISENFQFQISYNERGDYKTNRQSLVFEFYYSPLTWLNLSVYGSPNTLKKEDDIGFSSTFALGPTSQMRLFYTLVDFTHNKRNEDTDTYSQKPVSFGAIWRLLANENIDFVEASLKQEQKLVQNFSNNRIYSFASIQGQLLSRHSITPTNQQFIQTEWNIYKGHEEDTLNTDQGISRWDIKSLDGLIQYENSLSWCHLLGIRYNYAEWNSSGGRVIHNDWIPHSWFRLFSNQFGGYSHHIDLGYEFTWHRAQGDMSLRSTLDKNNVLEHRFNTRYQLLTTQKTMLHIILSFDLDEFGTGETWEGGSMQYSMSF